MAGRAAAVAALMVALAVVAASAQTSGATGSSSAAAGASAAGTPAAGTPAAGTPGAGTPGAAGQPAGSPAGESHVPVPWKPEEFSPFANNLRRGEILFFGSLPFSFFYTFEAYDLFRFTASGFDPLQAPWPFRAAGDIQYTDAEKGWLVGSAVVLSLGVAVTDFLIRRFRAEHAAPSTGGP